MKASSQKSILIFGLIAISGNPAFSNTTTAPFIYFILLTLTLASARGVLHWPFLRRFSILASIYCIIFAMQFLNFGLISLSGSIFFLAKLLMGGLIIHHLREKFISYYFELIYALSAISLVCYFALLTLGPESFPNLFDQAVLGGNLKSIGIHTVVMTDEWWRNSGMMWEPGAFQGIINLAIFLTPANILWAPRNRFKLLVMIIALLTTFSTTGYIVLFLTTLYKIVEITSDRTIKSILFIVIAAGAGFAIMELDFLAAKIVHQVTNSISREDFSPDRFGAFMFDLHYIEKSPLIGNGFNDTTRFADHTELIGQSLGHGNGLSNFTATLGLIGLLSYMYGLLTSGYGSRRRDRVAFITCVTALSFGQQFLNYPLFLGLPFLIGFMTPERSFNWIRKRTDSPSNCLT